MKQQFEEYLIKCDYATITPSGNLFLSDNSV